MSDTRKTTKPNVPNLRFPGFEGEWEECTIKDFGRVVTGSTPPTSDNRYYENGLRLWASPADLRGDKYISETCTKLSEKGFAKTRVIPQGATMVTCIGSTIGKMGMASCEMSTNQQINSIISNTQTDSQYLYYAIQARFHRYSQSIAVQAVPILSKSSFEQLKNYRPLLQEQQKVGSFLDLIDRRITIQNKVIEKYESLIKALCQILITSPNGTVCHIGDVLKIGSGKDHKHLNIGTIPVFGTGGYMLSVNDWLYEGESVCIGRKGTIDNPFFVDGKFWTVDTLFYTYDFNGVLPKFCYYLFRTINWLQYNEASGVPSLSKSTIERIQIRIPCMDEQAKAVQVLDSVEMEITCRRKLLNLYKSIKQYLISQLFI